MHGLTSLPPSRAAHIAQLRVVERILAQWSDRETAAAADPVTADGLAELQRIRAELIDRLPPGD